MAENQKGLRCIKKKTVIVKDMHLSSQYSSINVKDSYPAAFSVCGYD